MDIYPHPVHKSILAIKYPMTITLKSTISILFHPRGKGPHKLLNDGRINQSSGGSMMNFELMSLFHIALSDSLHQLQLSFLPPKLQRCYSISFHYKLQNNFKSLAVELKYYLWESHREYIINIFCYRFIEEMFMEYLLGARQSPTTSLQ